MNSEELRQQLAPRPKPSKAAETLAEGVGVVSAMLQNEFGELGDVPQ